MPENPCSEAPRPREMAPGFERNWRYLAAQRRSASGEAHATEVCIYGDDRAVAGVIGGCRTQFLVMNSALLPLGSRLQK